MTLGPQGIVASLGCGGWYERGVERLRDSFDRHGNAKGQGHEPIFYGYFVTGDFLGGPTHQEKPYAFKVKAIDGARYHHKRVLWVDSSVWLAANPAPIFDRIAADKCYLLRDGWSVGQWCSDAALPLLGITREEAFQIPLLYAIAVGLNFGDPRCLALFDDWKNLALNTDAFKGPWDNKDGAASSDPRVLGHRHDQTALSVLAWRHGLPTVPVGGSYLRTLSAGESEKPGDVLVARGM